MKKFIILMPVYNDWNSVSKLIKEKIPHLKFVIAHGQLKPQILEERITKFYNQEVPLMISTNIIENGLELLSVSFSAGYPGINEPREVEIVKKILEIDKIQKQVLDQILNSY